MKLYVCPNGFTIEQDELAKDCLRTLVSLGHACAASERRYYDAFLNLGLEDFAPEEADLIVSLGGDGALLRAAQVAISADKPLIGINSGRLGYLCAMGYKDLPYFDRIVAECIPSKRKLISCTLSGERVNALNDIVLTHRYFGTTVDLRVSLSTGNELRSRGDGLIFATPTGSTAYNIAVRGPIVDNDAPVITLTPVNPHSYLKNALVLPESAVFTVSERSNQANVYADGVHVGALTGEATIALSDKKLRLLTRRTTVGSLELLL